ncbi:hypothetical protein ACS0TY_006906 [Phlomoides rotata]
MKLDASPRCVVPGASIATLLHHRASVASLYRDAPAPPSPPPQASLRRRCARYLHHEAPTLPTLRREAQLQKKKGIERQALLHHNT